VAAVDGTQDPPETAAVELVSDDEDEDVLGAVPPPNRLCVTWL
jgi:hypothetical protein